MKYLNKELYQIIFICLLKEQSIQYKDERRRLLVNNRRISGRLFE
jgi:hypothetical protein